MVIKKKIGMIPGTGKQSKGIALRLALAGHNVLIGSRSEEKAKKTAAKLNKQIGIERFRGHSNSDVAEQCNILFVVLPYDHLVSTIKELTPHLTDQTILVDSIVPLTFVKGNVKYKEDLPYNSASEHLQAILPDEHIVVGAFKTVSAAILNHISEPINVDVFVTSDNKNAKNKITTLLNNIDGLRALDAGPLFMSRTIEQMTALVINLNKLNNLSHSSFKVIESNK